MTDLTVTPPAEVQPPPPPEGDLSPEPEEGDRPLSVPSPPSRGGDNHFLRDQLQAGDRRFARIYAFSYEGHYYDLPKPAIFLVHGPGADPEAFRPLLTLPNARVSRAPADAERTGVANTPSSFSEDMRVWSYDKGDFSIRMDIETGPFEQILLESELRPEKLEGSYSGASARLSGASARLSGASARLKGRGGGFSD